MCCRGVEKADVTAQGGETGVLCGGNVTRERGRGGHEGRGTLHGGQGVVSLGIGKWMLHWVGAASVALGGEQHGSHRTADIVWSGGCVTRCRQGARLAF